MVILSLLMACPSSASLSSARAYWLGQTQKNTASSQVATIFGKLLDKDGAIKEADVYLNTFKDEQCAKLFMEGIANEKNVKKVRACTTDIGPISPNKDGEYKFTELKPGYFALVVCWNMKEKQKRPIIAFQKGEFGISYFEGAKYNSVATGKAFYVAGGESVAKDFDYTKGEVTKETFPPQ